MKYNMWLNPLGAIRTSPTKNTSIDAKLSYVDGMTPMALVVVSTDRRVLQELYNNHNVEIEPNSKASINEALNESKFTPPPLRPLTPYEMVGMIDEVKLLEAKEIPEKPKDFKYHGEGSWPNIKKGNKYKFRRLKYSYARPLSKKKMHTDPDGRTYVLDHELERYGVDAGYVFRDEDNQEFVFRDNPVGQGEFASTWVWKFFEMPEIKTVAEHRPKLFEHYNKKLELLEELNGIPFYPGQKDYIARVLCVDEAMVSGDVGTGKTCMAISIKNAKNAKRCLIVAPKGTVKDASGHSVKHDPAQWVAEINKFSPDTKVYTLFTLDDYKSLLRPNGTLPPGMYITYPNAFCTTKAFEKIPKAWAANKREQKFRERLRDLDFDAPYDKEKPPSTENQWHRGVGQTRNGFTCIVKPSLCTLSKHQFDMALIDEAHIMQTLDSAVTSCLLRLQPKYRYAFTATPVPNMLPNIFPIAGWLAVPNWYHGEKSNPRWPYTIEGEGDFKSTFHTQERDFTEESVRNNGSYCVKISPTISQTQRLLKVLKSIVAYISKEECNPDVVDCEVETIRVPLGFAQKKLYAHNLDISNIPWRDPKTKYGVQLQRLRGICADPAGRSFNNDWVSSNFNPKLITTLELIGDVLQKGEQIIHISSSCGQTTELIKRLGEAGIECSRIDSEASNHVREANNFKNGKTKVLAMGAKCAVGHSFKDCNNMIIGSFDWSFGAFHQAMGRVYRLNSTKDVNIKVLLNKDTIEEAMFDKLADKRDAATVCLLGEYVPADFKEGDASEVFAEHFLAFDSERVDTEPEIKMEAQWGKLKGKLAVQANVEIKDKQLA
jgi:hypothetical protein